MDAVDVLLREYEIVARQIEHWDNLFWRTSQFFLAQQSVLLAAVGGWVSGQFAEDATNLPSSWVVLAAAVISNIWLNYVWFRANRRNREYLEVRFARAQQIEDDPAMRGVLAGYRLQTATLRDPKHAKHSNSQFEIHLPTVFMLAWVMLATGIVAVRMLSVPLWPQVKLLGMALALLPVACTVGLVAWVERKGALIQRSGTVFETMQAAKRPGQHGGGQVGDR
jgi:hypothetical protein